MIILSDCAYHLRTVATLALAALRSSYSARSHPHSARSFLHSARSHPHSARSHLHSASRLDLIHTRIDLINCRLDLIHTRLDLIHTRLDLIHTRLDVIHTRLDLIHTRLDLIHTRLVLIQTLLDLHSHSAGSHPHSARSHPLRIFVKNNRQRTCMEAAMSRGKSSSSSSPSKGCTARLDRRDLAPKINNFKQIMVWWTWTRDRNQRKIHSIEYGKISTENTERKTTVFV